MSPLRSIVLLSVAAVLMSFGWRKHGALFDPKTNILKATGHRLIAGIHAYQITDRAAVPYKIHHFIDTTFRRQVKESDLSELISGIDTRFSLCLDVRVLSSVSWKTSARPPCRYLEERYTLWLAADDLKGAKALPLHYTNWQEDEYYSCDSIAKRWRQ